MGALKSAQCVTPNQSGAVPLPLVLALYITALCDASLSPSKHSVGNAECARQRLPALRLLLLRQPPQQHLCGHRAARGAPVPFYLPYHNAVSSRRSAAAACAAAAARPPLTVCRVLCPGPRCQQRTPRVVATAPVTKDRLHSMHGLFAMNLCGPRLAAHALLKGQEEVAALLRRTAQQFEIWLGGPGRHGPVLWALKVLLNISHIYV